jgi:hypothetical protein
VTPADAEAAEREALCWLRAQSARPDAGLWALAGAVLVLAAAVRQAPPTAEATASGTPDGPETPVKPGI